MRRAWPSIGLGLLVVIGCGDAPIALTIDVVSDWQPGLDFVSVESALSRDEAGGGEIRQETFAVTGTEDFIDGVRVAELDDVRAGPLFVRVTLRDATGRAIASRLVSLVLGQSFAATVLLTRSCRDVECPAPMGAPELGECQGGTCVDPRCSPSTPMFCPPPGCSEDAECASAIDWCGGERLCRRGYCFCRETDPPPLDTGPPLDTRPPPDCRVDADCGAATPGDWSACAGFADVCAESGGTRSRDVTTPVCREGTCATEVAPETEACTRDTDGVGCDDGNACTTPDACAGGTCTGPARVCNDGNPCTSDGCNPATGCTTSAMAEHSVCGAAYQRCCGGACVDTRSSESHCGGCGINCAGGFNCVQYSGRTVCECAANTDCPGGADHICSPTYAFHCGCRTSAVCPGPMTCLDLAGALNYCTY